MAKAKKEASSEVSPIPENPQTPRPRLHKLIVKNFRAIGMIPVEIGLDEIVLLVGPNNAGKSSILRAYEDVMKQGSKEGRLQIEDFPNGIVDPNELPEIELQTIFFEHTPGKNRIGQALRTIGRPHNACPFFLPAVEQQGITTTLPSRRAL